MTRPGRRPPAPRARQTPWRIVVLALLLQLAALSPQARATAVDLALVLAVDVSDSIDTEEARLQREGYMAAIQHPRVLQAIKGGRHGRIAVAYFEWADAGKQALIVDWMVVADEGSARIFAERLRPAPRLKGHFTSISAALTFATALFQRSTFQPGRRIIDISGDGKNNNGPPLAPARARTLRQEITINGLAIVDSEVNPYTGMPPENIDRYYREQVIGGDGAFVIVVRDSADFEKAISRKMLREITGAPAETAVAHRVDE